MADNQHLWDRFARLGEMMGDGLHHEDKSIVAEHRKCQRRLPKFLTDSKQTT